MCERKMQKKKRCTSNPFCITNTIIFELKLPVVRMNNEDYYTIVLIYVTFIDDYMKEITNFRKYLKYLHLLIKYAAQQGSCDVTENDILLENRICF